MSEVIGVPEELVEAVISRQVFIEVPKVVVAELAGPKPLGLQVLCDGRVFGLETEVGAWQSHLGKSGAERALARDERGAPRRIL